ncbi:MAG: Rrf2 family transcriptional regulator [Eggerthellaceae bacterium]|jgi:Rrf2 family protein|nr:Rrf2 family transcriptional regulator [Eggerthellaceae bacterium]
MDITRRSDYACRILRAAYNSRGTRISVAEISEIENIPYSFARGIQHDLMKSGLVKTIRGKHGGLVLNCDPEEVTLLDVLKAIQGPVTIAVCSHNLDYCEKQPECVFNCVWRGADKWLNRYFASITLEELFTLGAQHPAVKAVFNEGGEVPCVKKADAVEEVGFFSTCPSENDKLLA